MRFEGQGCAISTASASLMTEAVKGRRRAEIAQLYRRGARAADPARTRGAERELGKLAALAGVARISRARQVREPVLAYAERGARATRTAPVSTE